MWRNTFPNRCLKFIRFFMVILPSHTLRMPHHALCDIIPYANNTGACLHHMTMGGESNFVHWARGGVGQILQVCGMCCSMKCRTE